jgi:protein-tyrosine phosphatase
MTKTGILFVCTANICRSPTAEGVFRAHAARAGIISRLRIDSAGTHDYYVGDPPDWRATQTALRRGYDLTPLRGRQVELADFAHFDRIYAMDRRNLDVLTGLRPPDHRGQLALFLDLVPELGVREMPDPYGGGPDEFERVLDLIEHASEALVKQLVNELR